MEDMTLLAAKLGQSVREWAGLSLGLAHLVGALAYGVRMVRG
jgi:hypothetical protein